jgi:putative intracellular protease/amidase
MTLDRPLSDIPWPDAELEGIANDYERVSLSLELCDGTLRTVYADGYIGYRLTGFWDEAVIAFAALHDDHPYIAECSRSITERQGENWLDSGSPRRNERRWSAQIIELSDGAELAIVAAAFSVAVPCEVVRPDNSDLSRCRR